MNLDPFSKSKDPLSAGSLNPAANKDIFTDNSKKGGGLGRVRKKAEADPADAGPPPEAMAEPEKEKPAVLLRNPKWEADKVGFNEETPISVEAEIPAEHANKKKIAFELFAKTPKGPERISQGEGMVENGKASCSIPVYIPQYKDEEGSPLQAADFYFTAKHSLSELLDGSKVLKNVNVAPLGPRPGRLGRPGRSQDAGGREGLPEIQGQVRERRGRRAHPRGHVSRLHGRRQPPPPKKAGEAGFQAFGGATHLTDGIDKAMFVDICDAYKTVWTGFKRVKELTGHEMELCRINYPEDPKITVSNAGAEMQLCELDLKDRAVILHEYGHFIGTKVLGGLDHPGYGYNDDATESHGGTTLEHYESAWNEGHATFLSCALTDNPHYHDGYDTTLDFFLDSDGTKLGPHCEGSIQEALWQIYKVHKTDFKDGFWKAFTDRSIRTCRTIFDFFDNWKDLKLAKLDKVVESFKDFGMEFGYRYPSDKFRNVAAPKVFDEAKREFAAIPELHANKGSLGAGTIGSYNEEFYNRNKHFNAGKLGAGSTIAAPKAKVGNDFIAPVRFQVKA